MLAHRRLLRLYFACCTRGTRWPLQRPQHTHRYVRMRRNETDSDDSVSHRGAVLGPGQGNSDASRGGGLGQAQVWAPPAVMRPQRFDDASSHRGGPGPGQGQGQAWVPSTAAPPLRSHSSDSSLHRVVLGPGLGQGQGWAPPAGVQPQQPPAPAPATDQGLLGSPGGSADQAHAQAYSAWLAQPHPSPHDHEAPAEGEDDTEQLLQQPQAQQAQQAQRHRAWLDPRWAVASVASVLGAFSGVRRTQTAPTPDAGAPPPAPPSGSAPGASSSGYGGYKWPTLSFGSVAPASAGAAPGLLEGVGGAAAAAAAPAVAIPTGTGARSGSGGGAQPARPRTLVSPGLGGGGLARLTRASLATSSVYGSPLSGSFVSPQGTAYDGGDEHPDDL
ncbi:hypothetical protein FOA52_012730 [Chlamydomonas sp. UWO 241]|nr:hypothetical protein FOA52_012730 [Chlamydomonas sp. UWO 241]